MKVLNWRPFYFFLCHWCLCGFYNLKLPHNEEDLDFDDFPDDYIDDQDDKDFIPTTNNKVKVWKFINRWMLSELLINRFWFYCDDYIEDLKNFISTF